MGITFAFLVLLQAASGDPVDADQFHRLMQAAHSSIHDVTFVFEGELKAVADRSVLGISEDLINRQFQASYVYRNDGAQLFEEFSKKNHASAPVQLEKRSSLGATDRLLGVGADRRADTPIIREGKPLWDSYNRNPTHLVFIDFFNRLGDPRLYNYRFRGWEELDGHRCLGIQLDREASSPDAPPARDEAPATGEVLRFWIDLERGGHPLQVELWNSGQLVERYHIELVQLPGPNSKLIWFPLRSTVESFEWRRKTYPDAVLRRTVKLVEGSLRFNQNPPDSLFSVTGRGLIPSESRWIGTMRKEFETTPLRERPRTDPASVSQRLDRQLEEANKQAAELEASSPARTMISGTLLVQIALTSIGIGVLAFALWKVRRG